MEVAISFVKHRWTRWHTLVTVAAVTLITVWHGRQHVQLRQSLAGPCALKFKRYVPSEWEEWWLLNAKDLQGRVCETMKVNDTLSGVWIDGMDESWNLDHPVTGEVLRTFADAPHVFSAYEYTDTCSGKPVTVPVEPLVGLLRHPW